MIEGLPGPGTGRAIADALYLGSTWRHRKVESLRLMEGERGRRRVSLDCTPPPEPALAYDAAERAVPTIDDVDGPVMVPLAMISKGALRHFDVTDSAGAPLPILSRSENAWVALSVLLNELNPPAEVEMPKLHEALWTVVQGPPEAASRMVERLLANGVVDGSRVLDLNTVSTFAEGLLYDLAENFLLIALVPSDKAGQRLLLKYSSHWRTILGGGRVGLRNRLLAAAGFGAAPVDLQVEGAADAASYHLEVHAPPGLQCSGLSLPADGGGLGAEQPDTTTDVVAHAVGSYTAVPADPARLKLAVPTSGLRSVAVLTGLFTAATFVLEETLPGARPALLDAGDGAVAVLLAAPAVALALLARPGENALASHLLAPLRWLVLAYAALLIGGAASLVGRLHEPYISVLWRGGAILTTVLTLCLMVGSLVSTVADTDA